MMGFGFALMLVTGTAAVEMQILATQIQSMAHLQTMIEESRKFVSQTREIKEITVEAYHAIDEIRHLTWDQLRVHALQSVSTVYPELREIYGDVKNIGDLRRRSSKARQTIDGMVHATLWRPLQSGIAAVHDDSDLIAAIREHQARQEAILAASRAELHMLQEDCLKGHGACGEAANRATITSGLLLTDIHGSLGLLTESMRRDRIKHQHELLDRYRTAATLMAEINTNVQQSLGLQNVTCDRDCLYRKYAGAAQRDLSLRMRESRNLK